MLKMLKSIVALLGLFLGIQSLVSANTDVDCKDQTEIGIGKRSGSEPTCHDF